ncbi:hypothetical protein JCM14036_32160 [Desulfotomaculum defluvii]
MARRYYIGGLDIGTTKIVAVVAEISPSGCAVVKGLGESTTIGIRKGSVTDSVSLSKVIEQAVKESQDMAGVKMDSVYVASQVVRQLTDQYNIVDEKLTESIKMAGLEVEEIVPAIIASAHAVLTDTQKNIGTVLVDIGGSITDIAVFDQGLLKYTVALNVGCDHISSDLAVCLRTSISEGERIKRMVGLEKTEPQSYLEVSSLGGHEKRKVPTNTAIDIIHSRVQEIFELIHKELNHQFRLKALAGGLVLTGGGALLRNIVKYANLQLNLSKVEIGIPAKMGVPKEEWNSPTYASSFGLVMYGAQRSSRRSERLSGWREVINKFI